VHPIGIFVVVGEEPLLEKDLPDGQLAACNCRYVSRRHDHVRIGRGRHSVTFSLWQGLQAKLQPF
jgi:hypothetical protein